MKPIQHRSEASACDADDDDTPVWGAAAIAREAGLANVRQAFYLLEQGVIPAKKIKGKKSEGNRGGRWVSTRRAIRRALVPEMEIA